MSLSQSLASARKTMTFHRNPKARSYFSYANENRKAGRFNDVTIKVGNLYLPTHKMILAFFSKYFERMFVTEMSEKYQSTIEIERFDGVTVKLIMDYFYSESIVIDSGNVLKILEAADYMQVDDVKRFCFEFLESGLTTDTCLEIISAYNFYKPDASLKQAYQFLSEHLDEIALQPNFKALSKDDLVSIIAKLDLKIVKESTKYTAIFNWMKYDVETRKANVTTLFKLVDLSRVEYEFLKDVIATDSVVKENNACLNAVLKCHITRSQEMSPGTSGFKILCIGSNYRYLPDGIDSRSWAQDALGSVVEVYNSFSTSTSTYPRLPVNVSSGHDALFLKDSIFLILSESNSVKRGVRKAVPVQRVFQLNLRNIPLEWREVASLNISRTSFGAIVYKGSLLIAGGYHNRFPTKSVELYEMQTNKWRNISSLNSVRANFSLVSNGECVFAIGGRENGQNIERLSDLEGKWELVAPMSVPRHDLAAVFCDGFVYAIGGSRTDDTDGCVEKYNPDRNEWSDVANMNIARKGHSACVLHRKIIVVGGKYEDDDEDFLIQEMDCYDPVTGRWSLIGNSPYTFESQPVVVV